MDLPILFIKTILLRPYVFVFLAISLVSSSRLLGWKRTGVFFGITWCTAFVCEFSSTRIHVPFGAYFYTGSTVGQELYISNIPFMDSLSFTFLLYASYCLALLLLFPRKPSGESRGFALPSWAVVFLTALLFMLSDIVIDPVALRGERWFLGKIYGYPEHGLYFGVPIANFIGWFVVGLVSMTGFRVVEQRLDSRARSPIRGGDLLLGCGLYYVVLAFNLSIAFWIGEPVLGIVGILLHLPLMVLVLFRLRGWFSLSWLSMSNQGN